MSHSVLLRLKSPATVISILKYLKPLGRSTEKTQDGLPNPAGSLSSYVPSPAIDSANEHVRQAIQAEATTKKTRTTRGSYFKLSPELRARIGNYSCDNGIGAASRHFSRPSELGRQLNESTVRGLKAYLYELSRKRKEMEELTITELRHAKRGRPLDLVSASMKW